MPRKLPTAGTVQPLPRSWSATEPASPLRLVWLSTTTCTSRSASRPVAWSAASVGGGVDALVAGVFVAALLVAGVLDGAWLIASRVAVGEVVEAAAPGWPGSSPRQTASEVTRAATATTARTEGISAAATVRPVRCAPRRLRGTGELMTGSDASAGQTSMPSRRAERARCRAERSRRSRLTSIGSAASASGRSIRALSTW